MVGEGRAMYELATGNMAVAELEWCAESGKLVADLKCSGTNRMGEVRITRTFIPENYRIWIF